MSELDPRTINAGPIITKDGRRHFHGRQDHFDILTSICTRIVASVVTEMADYITRDDRNWPGTLLKAENQVLKILQEQQKEKEHETIES